LTDLTGGTTLLQNYPNPFSGTTEIGFMLSEATLVRLSVVDQLGREVSVLVDEELSAGAHRVKWEVGTNASGIYYYVLESGGERSIKPMRVMK
jgi:hypothetical protein